MTNNATCSYRYCYIPSASTYAHWKHNHDCSWWLHLFETTLFHHNQICIYHLNLKIIPVNIILDFSPFMHRYKGFLLGGHWSYYSVCNRTTFELSMKHVAFAMWEFSRQYISGVPLTQQIGIPLIYSILRSKFKIKAK